MKTINKNEFEQVVRGERVLVDFYADWCAECNALTPFLEKAEEQTDIPIFRFDCDSDRDFAVALGIMSIPALILFENGEELTRRFGMADENEILRFIKQ